MHNEQVKVLAIIQRSYARLNSSTICRCAGKSLACTEHSMIPVYVDLCVSTYRDDTGKLIIRESHVNMIYIT